jgi:hypothetical protein
MLSLAALTLAVVMPHLAQARCMTDDAVESFFTGDVRPYDYLSHITLLDTVSFDVDCSVPAGVPPRATACHRAAFHRMEMRLRPFSCFDPFRCASSVPSFFPATVYCVCSGGSHWKARLANSL